jgi:predicted phosphodiesterase
MSVTRDGKTGRFAKADQGQPLEEVRVAETNVEIDEETALKFLRAKGYDLSKEVCPTDKTVEIVPKLIRGKEYAIGLISDTHFCSKYLQRTCAESAYSYFAEQGIHDVLHAGDIADGEKMYKGHEYEIYIHGVDDQAQFVIDKYPRRDGITTHFVLGNHDCSFLKNAGANLGERIANRRPDLNYCGILGAEMVFGTLRIGLLHPKGAGAYARSYHLQKKIEQMPPDKKPHVFIMGHFHSNCIIPMYRNVLGWMFGCTQAQTPHEKALGLYPECGWGVLRFRCDSTGALKYNVEWIPWFKMDPEDYR